MITTIGKNTQTLILESNRSSAILIGNYGKGSRLCATYEYFSVQSFVRYDDHSLPLRVNYISILLLRIWTIVSINIVTLKIRRFILIQNRVLPMKGRNCVRPRKHGGKSSSLRIVPEWNTSTTFKVRKNDDFSGLNVTSRLETLTAERLFSPSQLKAFWKRRKQRWLLPFKETKIKTHKRFHISCFIIYKHIALINKIRNVSNFNN